MFSYTGYAYGCIDSATAAKILRLFPKALSILGKVRVRLRYSLKVFAETYFTLASADRPVSKTIQDALLYYDEWSATTKSTLRPFPIY